MLDIVVPAGESSELCSLRRPPPARGRKERGLLAVVALTAVMMLVEIVAGYTTHSMALTADGWHMATHVGALGMSALAYSLARRFAGHRAFVLGTGKIQSLAGYTSALLLAVIAVSMAYESAWRLFSPSTIDFASSLPVAVVGLVVNLLSVKLLHNDEHDEHDHHGHHHDHAHHHDHNHQAAVMHVIADALTSALAIGALLAGRYLGVLWLDPVTGIVGGAVILKWAYDLCKNASYDLLDVELDGHDEERMRRVLSESPGVSVADLHVWSIGAGKRCGIASVQVDAERDGQLEALRARVLAAVPLTHLTIELRPSTNATSEPRTFRPVRRRGA